METKRVYTKATERLKRLHKEYGGLKSGNSDAAQWFDNTDTEWESGNFYAEERDRPVWYNEERMNFKELTEEEFIRFMDLTDLDRQLRVADVMLDVEGNDNVNNPSHYTQGNIEVIDFIDDQKFGYHLGNAVKYIARAGKKDPSKTEEDLRKAIWYIERFIKKNFDN